MKKIVMFALLALVNMGSAFAQTEQVDKNERKAAEASRKAEIKFDKTTHNFGTFSEDDATVTCTFDFTNTGSAPLVIHQAIASCGCTVPTYTKYPIKPGEKGKIDITYNGTGKFPGHFRKTITVRSNAKQEMVRLVIEGNMTASAKQDKKDKK
ncbi:MAG: DUF1573 domain-containing protein [Clostridium sp.]|nr:DUF1573 domain-containing protein [Clostridium sp.]